jgi:hypothetical protein
LLEDDVASKVSNDANVESRGDPEASNQVDMLVDHIAKEVVDANCNGSHHQGSATQSVNTHKTSPVQRSGSRDKGFGNLVIESVVVSSTSSGGSVECVAETVMTTQKHSLRKSAGVSIPSTTVKADMCPE